MTRNRYAKVLNANDIGATGAHQAGILVPKSDVDLLAFFPKLHGSRKNPDAWIRCEDASGKVWNMRFVYYNNKLHDPNGTRNEYRITHMTGYLRLNHAREGDSIVFEAMEEPGCYRISVEAADRAPATKKPGVIKLAGWRRIH